MNNKIKRIKELVELLNHHRNEYYNNSNSAISDFEYDKLFDELQNLEFETGFVMTTSPTQTVGYEVKSELQKVTHNHPMLSLDKTKSLDDVIKFLGDKTGICMAKMDGLTCSLRYVNGELVSAETRGNGEVGEDILHCAKTIKNIPLKIECIDEVVVDGEVIITYEDFEKINESLPEDKKYKNPRNLASGSIRQLDSSIAAKRNMKFIAWKLVSGWMYPHNRNFNKKSFLDRLMLLSYLGFDVVSCIQTDRSDVETAIEWIKKDCNNSGYPIDGCVVGYDDVLYGESLGATSHHLRSQIAFKFYDDVYETTLLDVEWNTTRSGIISPVAIFEPIDLDGAITTRATLHNLSIIRQLELGIGDQITVYRSNMVIPKIDDNLTRSNTLEIPQTCPCCGAKALEIETGISKVLMCSNVNCPSKRVNKFTHFVSRKCMNIDGLSEATLETLINKGFITTFKDIYQLSEHKAKLMLLDGFGKKSVENLLDAIEASRDVDLENFICALGIPMIGASQSKVLAKEFGYRWDNFEDATVHEFDFTTIDGFGKVLHTNIHTWYDTTYIDDEIEELIPFMRFKQVYREPVKEMILKNYTFVITGSMNHFDNRDQLKEKIESLGGKVSGSVTNKTRYLINNDIESTSSKNKKAKSLNIPIITEEQFLALIGEK